MPSIDKSPAYQWYPKDWDTDEAVKLMTYEEEGIYRRLLDHQALHGGIPVDVRQVARLVPKVSVARFLRLWPALEAKFPIQGERRINQKLQKVKAESQAYRATKSASGKKGAASTWQRTGKPHSTPDVRLMAQTVAETVANGWPASATASAKSEIDPVRTDREQDPPDPELAHPVSRFMRQTYPAIYAKARNGAAYKLNEPRDFGVCCDLVETYGDRLPVMLEYFLNMPPAKDVLNQPGTPRQFAHMAPQVDAELRKHGR
jgi:uncharacterized protein YdaU (DUF1376 family)